MRQGLELPKGFDIVTILVSQWLCVSMCVHEMVCDSFKQLHIFAFDSWDYQVLSFLIYLRQLAALDSALKNMKDFYNPDNHRFPFLFSALYSIQEFGRLCTTDTVRKRAYAFEPALRLALFQSNLKITFHNRIHILTQPR